MLRFASPAALWVGAAAALVPLILHLIARRPAERVALPTTRFLRPDPHTRLRLRRRPTDLPLLLLRTLFVLLVAAAFARPEWVPARSGSVQLVLLDRGAAMVPVWDAAVEAARARLWPGDSGGAPGGGLVVFDTAARTLAGPELTVARFDSIAAAGPAAAATAYGAAFPALAALVAALPAVDSARVALVTRPRWEAWSPGLALARESAWPGSMELVALDPASESARAPAEDDRGSPGRALVLASPGSGVYVEAALGAVGWDVARLADTTAAAALPAAPLYVQLGPPAPEMGVALLERARGGATVMVAGPPPAGALGAALPWRPAADAMAGGDVRFGVGVTLRGAAGRHAGAAAPGAQVPAAWDDGRAAAAADTAGAGCLVYGALDLEGGRLPASPDFPAAVAALAGGCRAPGAALAARAPVGPLDTGARAVLERADAPVAVALAALPAGAPPRSWFRWLILAALAAAMVETWMSYGKRGAAERATE